MIADSSTVNRGNDVSSLQTCCFSRKSINQVVDLDAVVFSSHVDPEKGASACFQAINLTLELIQCLLIGDSVNGSNTVCHYFVDISVGVFTGGAQPVGVWRIICRAMPHVRKNRLEIAARREQNGCGYADTKTY